jgi:hypothetical protein
MAPAARVWELMEWAPPMRGAIVQQLLQFPEQRPPMKNGRIGDFFAHGWAPV